MTRTFSKGQIILFKDDPIIHLYKIVYGAVKAYYIDDYGGEHILTVRSATEIFPMNRLIGDTKALFFYEALTECKAEIINPEAIELEEVTRQAIELYYESLQRIADLETSAANRVKAATTYLINHGISPTHQNIAELSFTTRETVSRVLKHINLGRKDS